MSDFDSLFKSWLESEYKKLEVGELEIVYWQELFQEAFAQNSHRPVHRFKENLVYDFWEFVEMFVDWCRAAGHLDTPKLSPPKSKPKRYWPYS